MIFNIMFSKLRLVTEMPFLLLPDQPDIIDLAG